jgi:hypothetical protein
MVQLPDSHNQVEVDSASDVFGIIYRVWQGMSLLGTFYRSPVDEKWVAQSDDEQGRYDTPDEAQNAVVKASR